MLQLYQITGAKKMNVFYLRVCFDVDHYLSVWIDRFTRALHTAEANKD